MVVTFSLFGRVELGIDRLFQSDTIHLVEGKRVGLITNQTGVNGRLELTLDLFEKMQEAGKLTLAVVFAPEHGLYGEEYAGKTVVSGKTPRGTPIFSLHGEARRPKQETLKKLDVLVYDIQDIGCRSYTFATTLFYVMEEAAKAGIEVVVLDRPNPMGGKFFDGPMLDASARSFVGYVNVPYCHGMTIGELARYFNEVYKIECRLTVVPMRGWKRWMRFDQTGLAWIPTSPNIPEAVTPLFYPATGILGELQCVFIGIGYTLPFKMVAAPWINGTQLALQLNAGVVEGVRFQETRVKPFYGQYREKPCEGVLIIVTDWGKYNPIKVEYWLLDVLKRLYPQEIKSALAGLGSRLSFFQSIVGTKDFYHILMNEARPYSALVALHAEERQAFSKQRDKYLIPAYSE